MLRILTVALVLILPAGPAAADGSSAGQSSEESPPLGWRYLVDGGAVPFVYVPAAGALVLTLAVEPRAEPLLFDPGEGGAAFRDTIVPGWTLAVASSLSVVAVAAVPAPRRWYHAKGMAQAILTTRFLTDLSKHVFGRHRPYHDPAVPERSGSASRLAFPSGHASSTLVLTTYLALYLHDHVFPRWRAPGQAFAWWELVPHAGLAGAAVAVPMSRVLDHHHHPSDMVAGAALGASLAVGFYVWQERRADARRRSAPEHGMALFMAPAGPEGTPGLVLAGRF